nr:reverse transcriptase domain-containing protein [Tanacetum cinerariifolium]
MRTRSSSNLPVESPHNLSTSNPKRRNRRRFKQPFIFEESPVDIMADQRTMAELLRAPTEGYAEAIVVLPIFAEQFELKHSLINMMTSDQFFGLEKDNPHDHICWFNKITSTIKYKDVPNSAIKLMLFPLSLAGAARRWLEKEHPRSILTWEDLVSKFINEFFPPSRTTNLRNKISNFQQWFDESFHEACDRYKDLLRSCPHHGFTELHQLDTFYNALNPADQDSLNSVAGGNLLERRTQDVLTIIENKSKIAKLTHAVNQQTSAVTTAMAAILKQFQATPPPASVKAVEEIYVTCSGAHPYYQCLAADGNTFLELRDNIQGYIAAAAVNYNHGNSIYCPSEEDERVEETLTDQDLAEHTIKVPPPLKILKALLSNKEKLLELANTPLNENCSAVILKNLPKKLGDPGKFLNLCGFSLPEFISTRMTLELANRAICTPTGIARDVFVPVGKFTFPADFVIVDYESDHRFPFILGRPFLRTARALIDVHGEEMILRDGDERLTLNMRHDTSSYSSQPQKESINMINIYDDSSEDVLEELCARNHQSGNPTFPFHPKLTSSEVKDDVFDPDRMLKPLFPSPIPVEDNDSFLEKSDTSISYSDISLPEFETFIYHTKETNSGSTNTHADYSLPKYDSFLFEIEPDQSELTNIVIKDNLEELRVHFDIEEKNSGSTTVHADISLSILECFNFDDKTDPCELTSIVDSEIRKNVSSATNVNLPPEEDHSPLFAFVVWIFLSFITYPVVPPHIFSFRNKDTIFDPSISNYHFFSLLPNVSHRCKTFMKFNVYQKLLNESLMEILSSSYSLMEQ